MPSSDPLVSLDYQSLEVITKFLKNRDVVVWCTNLARSDANEHVDVEVAMREKGLGWTLRELAGDRQAKAQTGDAMDSLLIDTYIKDPAK
jgi:pre-mRNA-splicing helicase BRR2